MAPTSAQRGQRSRANSKREANPPAISVSTAPETDTPTRASKRRRKADDSIQLDDDEDIADTPPTIESAPVEQPDGDHLVSLVIQHLTYPKENPVQASKDHSNQLHESKDGVKAYAKIAAQDWTFYVTKLKINIGRTSDAAVAAAAIAADPSIADAEDAVHIDLGPSKTVSRQHAMIIFDSEGEEWHLKAKGRNGVKLDGINMKGGTSRPLKSGNVIEIGGVEMMFVLPTEISPLHIADTYLARANLLNKPAPAPVARPTTAVSASTISTPARPPPSSSSNLETPLPRSSSVAAHSVSRDLSNSVSHNSTFQQPIAPAPADYRRPGTPTSSRNNIMTTPRLGIPSTPMNGHSDIDLSLEENSHIKPQYSYAQMITQAIINTPDEKLNLNGIYNYITDQYAYYRRQASAGWQNSIRHNLSLNKAFDKVARSTDEPGKGMKWQLVSESREEMIRFAFRGGRGGHRGSSVPSSPSQLNYITHGPRDMAASSRKRRLSPIHSPPGAFTLTGTTPLAATPDRSVRRKGPLSSGVAIDGSPLPRPRTNRKPVPTSAAISYQMPPIQATPTQPSIAPAPTPSKMPASSQQTLAAPRSPTMASSYLQEDGSSFVTPAPPRVHPRLAPPSTVQKPSQHMPTSSPAPFWKYIDIGSTPLRSMLNLDSSPSRPGPLGLPDSSPPRLADSPSTRNGPRGATRDAGLTATPAIDVPAVDDKEKADHDRSSGAVAASQVVAQAVGATTPGDEETFDLTKGFQSIGSFHAVPQPGGGLSRGLKLQK